MLLKHGVYQKAFNAKIKNVTIDHTKGTGDLSTTQVFTQPLQITGYIQNRKTGNMLEAELKRKTLCYYCRIYSADCLHQLYEFKHGAK